MNKVILIGNLARDVEMTTTTNGISCARFTLAVQRKIKNEDGVRDADFINIVAWRGLADNCGKYLKKGSKVAITGNLQTRSYENKDGKKVHIFEIIAEEAEFLTPQNKNNEVVKVDEDEELPF